jgi:hypothetical protein
LDTIKKGDVEQVKMEVYRLNVAKGEPSILVNLHDDRYHHNPVFYATLIKDEGLCVKMVEYLVSQGVEAT